MSVVRLERDTCTGVFEAITLAAKHLEVLNISDSGICLRELRHIGALRRS